METGHRPQMTVAFNKDYGIQEVVRSILVSSTTERTLIPLVFRLNDWSLLSLPLPLFQLNSNYSVTRR
jgi:hypothetical protein